MEKLILFDIDGTLVNSSHNAALIAAIKNLHDLEVKIVRHEFAGSTDQLILAELLKRHGWSEAKIKTNLPKLIHELGNVYVNSLPVGSVVPLPGVKSLLQTLTRHPVRLGLITGNIKPIAKTKLEDAGIYKYFSVGGFGNDPHTKRSELVKIAIKRAGFEDKISQVYVIGDTPRDIEAAREGGASNKVGVATGAHSEEELRQAGADIVLADLANTNKVLEAVGI